MGSMGELTAAGAGWLTMQLLDFVRTGAEWVLWVLVVLSLASIAVMIERWIFYRRHSVDTHALRNMLVRNLTKGEIDGTVEALRRSGKSMEAHVLVYGLQHADRGPSAVQELMLGAMAKEQLRYSRFLSFLATLGSNAPFIGLFGTVLGIIQAFDAMRGMDLGAAGGGASAEVMGPLAEALIATGVGLIVAIPAVIAFNIFRGQVKKTTSNTELLARTAIAFLDDPDKPKRTPSVASIASEES